MIKIATLHIFCFFLWALIRFIATAFVFLRLPTYHINMENFSAVVASGMVSDGLFLSFSAFAFFVLAKFFARFHSWIISMCTLFLALFTIYFLIDFIIFYYILVHLSKSFSPFLFGDWIYAGKSTGLPLHLFIFFIIIIVFIFFLFQKFFFKKKYQSLEQSIFPIILFLMAFFFFIKPFIPVSFSLIEVDLSKNPQLVLLSEVFQSDIPEHKFLSDYEKHMIPENSYYECLLDSSHIFCNEDADKDGFFVFNDCDDMNASIHPTAEDTFGDFIDNDCSGTDSERPNIILVFLESFRDGITTEQGVPVTPFFDSLKKENIFFEKFYSNGVQSNMARIATLCSVLPNFGADIFMQYSNNDFLCLPHILNSQGYRSILFNGASLDFTNQRKMYEKMEFTQMFEPEKGKDDSLFSHWGIDDRLLYKRTLDWIDSYKEKDPYFLMLYTVSNHMPWEVNDKNFEIFGDLKYFNSLRYSDDALGLFYQELVSRNIFQNSIVIFISDSGQPMSEHGQGYSEIGYLYQENIHIPMIIFDTRGQGYYLKSIEASQIDVLPTLLDRLGIKTPNNFFGSSLFSLYGKVKQNRVISLTPFSGGKVAVIENDKKVIVNFDSKSLEVFDLKKDPKEKINIQSIVDFEEYKNETVKIISYNNWLLENNLYWDDSMNVLEKIKIP